MTVATQVPAVAESSSASRLVKIVRLEDSDINVLPFLWAASNRQAVLATLGPPGDSTTGPTYDSLVIASAAFSGDRKRFLMSIVNPRRIGTVSLPG